MTCIRKRSNRERCISKLNKELDDAEDSKIKGVVTLDVEINDGGISDASVLTKETGFLNRNRSRKQSG